MKKISLILFWLICSLYTQAQFSGDGYFLELPNCNVWGNFETEEDQSAFGGVYYRIHHSSGTIINVVPVNTLPDGRLYLRWTQYITYQNQWVTQYSGEMIVDETLQTINSICAGFRYSESPSGQLIAGIYRGDIRTLLRYDQGKSYPSETAWSPIAFTINGGAVTTSGFNPFDGLTEGYVMTTNGNVLGDYVLYSEPQTGGWGCLNGQYLHYYKSGYVSVICPTEFDVNTGEIKGIYYRYRVNASNLDRAKGIWKPSSWVLDIGGEIVFKRIPTRCPDNAPNQTLNKIPITGCLQAKMLLKYKYTGSTPIEARESWAPVLFTLTSGRTAPTPVSSDPCDTFCDTYCKNMGMWNGRYNGGSPCLLGTVSNASQGCDCER